MSFFTFMLAFQASAHPPIEGGTYSEARAKAQQYLLGGKGGDVIPTERFAVTERNKNAPVDQPFYVLGKKNQCFWATFKKGREGKELVMFSNTPVATEKCIYQHDFARQPFGFSIVDEDGGLCRPSYADSLEALRADPEKNLKIISNDVAMSYCFEKTKSYGVALGGKPEKPEEAKVERVVAEAPKAPEPKPAVKPEATPEARQVEPVAQKIAEEKPVEKTVEKSKAIEEKPAEDLKVEAPAPIVKKVKVKRDKPVSKKQAPVEKPTTSALSKAFETLATFSPFTTKASEKKTEKQAVASKPKAKRTVASALADKIDGESWCVVGGFATHLRTDKDGKRVCTTFGRSCGGDPHLFQCGTIFGEGVCVPRSPLADLSQRCAEKARTENKFPTVETYKKVSQTYEKISTRICSGDRAETGPCKVFNARLTEVKTRYAEKTDSPPVKPSASIQKRGAMGGLLLTANSTVMKPQYAIDLSMRGDSKLSRAVLVKKFWSRDVATTGPPFCPILKS